jgi:Endonuclease/Exonuclease/phosphatase family
MRIVSANVFCLNVTRSRAIEAVADQAGDVTVLIESTPGFDRHIERYLPPLRARGLTRRRGMPVSVHANGQIEVEDVRESGLGWIECRVSGVLLLMVHAIAPYLPWRLGKRRSQLAALGNRLSSISRDERAIAVGDFNTATFEPAWAELQSAAGDWRKLDLQTPRWRGTWPLGGAWAPIALDHALAPAQLADGTDRPASVRTFPVPGSDHMGLVVELPDPVKD